jgi:solute carrier family 25 (mitochondrial ornithine transporter) member 2/15
MVSDFDGLCSELFIVYAGQPLDTVKVKVQTFPHLYKNWVKCFTETFRLDGIRGLYAGRFCVSKISVL